VGTQRGTGGSQCGEELGIPSPATRITTWGGNFEGPGARVSSLLWGTPSKEGGLRGEGEGGYFIIREVQEILRAPGSQKKGTSSFKKNIAKVTFYSRP